MSPSSTSSRDPVNETVILDLDAIIDSRFGENKVPRFVRNRLKRFIHQDHLNGYLSKGYLGVEFAEQALVYYDANVTGEVWRTFLRTDAIPSPAITRSEALTH